MAGKSVFLDIDGTLTSPGSNEPPESALRAVRKAQELGHKVFLCSGRNYDMLKPLLKFGFDGAVASGGGYVFAGDDVLYDCLCARKYAKQKSVWCAKSFWESLQAAKTVYRKQQIKQGL